MVYSGDELAISEDLVRGMNVYPILFGAANENGQGEFAVGVGFGGV